MTRDTLRVFSGIEPPLDEAHRAYAYLFSVTFGSLAGVVRSLPLGDRDYIVATRWGIVCFGAALFFTVWSTSNARCRAKRLLRCGLAALFAFLFAAAFNFHVWHEISIVDLSAFVSALGGIAVFVLLLQKIGLKPISELGSFAGTILLILIAATFLRSQLL